MRLNHLTLLLSFLLFCSCTKPTGDVLPKRRGIVGEASATKQKRQPIWLPKFCLVDYSDKTSNLIKDLNRLYLFAIEVL